MDSSNKLINITNILSVLFGSTKSVLLIIKPSLYVSVFVHNYRSGVIMADTLLIIQYLSRLRLFVYLYFFVYSLLKFLLTPLGGCLFKGLSCNKPHSHTIFILCASHSEALSLSHILVLIVRQRPYLIWILSDFDKNYRYKNLVESYFSVKTISQIIRHADEQKWINKRVPTRISNLWLFIQIQAQSLYILYLIYIWLYFKNKNPYLKILSNHKVIF